jgi:RNA polymerase sigma-70 factor (ECF subfamily)
MGKISDKIIFYGLKNKDKEAFIKAYDEYADKIYRFVYFKIGNEEDAKDLTSAIFLKTWNHINNSRLADEKTLKALFYKIARNSVIDYYRSSRREECMEKEILSNAIDEKNDLLNQASVSSDWESVKIKMLELKDEYREILLLKYIEELSIGEIAKILDKSKGNVRVLIFRALKALKELMN